jgi:NADH dehydrogenase FAD-containing subunit
MPCRIGVDEWLRVPSVPDVFAIGDCSGFLESTGKEVLPALAQVISQTILTQFKNMRAFFSSFYLKIFWHMQCFLMCDRVGWIRNIV